MLLEGSRLSSPTISTPPIPNLSTQMSQPTRNRQRDQVHCMPTLLAADLSGGKKLADLIFLSSICEIPFSQVLRPDQTSIPAGRVCLLLEYAPDCPVYWSSTPSAPTMSTLGTAALAVQRLQAHDGGGCAQVGHQLRRPALVRTSRNTSSLSCGTAGMSCWK